MYIELYKKRFQFDETVWQPVGWKNDYFLRQFKHSQTHLHTMNWVWVMMVLTCQSDNDQIYGHLIHRVFSLFTSLTYTIFWPLPTQYITCQIRQTAPRVSTNWFKLSCQVKQVTSRDQCQWSCVYVYGSRVTACWQ